MRGVLTIEAEIRHIKLELSPKSQSLSHSEKDHQALVSYDYYNISYDTFRTSIAGPDPAQHNYITME